MSKLYLVIILLYTANIGCSNMEETPKEVITFLDEINSDEKEIEISHKELFKSGDKKIIIGEFERKTEHGIPYMYFLEEGIIEIFVDYSEQNITMKTKKAIDNLSSSEKNQFEREVSDFTKRRKEVIELINGGSVIILE